MQKNIFLQFLLILAGFGLILFFGSGYYFSGYREMRTGEKTFIEQQLLAQGAQIAELKLISDILVSENEAVSLRLEEERARRLSAEQERRTDVARLAELEQSVAGSKSIDLTDVVSDWRVRVAVVNCEWNFSSGLRATGAGSAVLIPGMGRSGGEIGLVTNRHVVNYEGFAPSACSIQFPDQGTSYNIAGSDIVFSKNTDSAIINIASPSTALRVLNSSSLGRCSADGSVGDEIVILGYPGIGSRTDITATEGIISGYESGHYLTSAKVERGNSGGAAISVNNNCYLGIPTFVDVGQIESLARILDQKLIK